MKVAQGVVQSQVGGRETVSIEPIGTRPADVMGIVQARSRPDLAKRFGIGRGSIGFNEFDRTIGDSDPEQITMQVDELAGNPDAIDFSSYTFLCRRDKVDRSLRRGSVIRVRLAPVEVLGLSKLWLASSAEVLY